MNWAVRLPVLVAIGLAIGVVIGAILGMLPTAAIYVGALLSVFTGKSALYSGARQLVIGAFAAVVTFGLGKVIGVSTGV